MPFADKEIKFNNFNSDFKRTEFMALPQGAHTIRILQDQAKTRPTHFFQVNNTTVLCLEDNCPICQNNKSLIGQFPENFRDQTGYCKVNWRFFVNVLDKTPAKVCECGKEYKALSMTICTCGKVLPDAAPLNKVKVLSKGITLRDDLDSIDKAIQNPNGEPKGLMNYDVTLMVSGAGRDTKITPVPRTDITDPIPEGLELFDLEKAVITLTPSEMLDVQRGTRLKDIFAARKNETKKADFAVEEAVSEEVVADVQSKINTLFGSGE